MIHRTGVAIAAAAIAAGLSVPGVRADDDVHIDDLLPAPTPGFVGDALHAEDGKDWAAPLPAAGVVPGSGSPPALFGAAEQPLPFIAHFGLSMDNSAGVPAVDGVFFSPSEGVELNARTSLSDGFSGTLGVTLRF